MSPQEINYAWIAPNGKLWRCTVCQKFAKYRAGYLPGFPASWGWDESCFMNSVLESEDQRDANDLHSASTAEPERTEI